MMYDKPKVTIDLDEYNSLLKQKDEAMRMDNLEINTIIAIQLYMGNPMQKFSIVSKRVESGGIVYQLSNDASMCVYKKSN
jgi:phage pi2 protein 07